MRYPIAALVVLLAAAACTGGSGSAPATTSSSLAAPPSTVGPPPTTAPPSIPVTTTTTAGAPVRPAALWLAGDGSLATLEANSGAVVIRAPITDQSVSTDLAFGFASIWAADPEAGAVVRIDPTTGSPVGAIAVAGRPTDIAVSSDAVWVTSLDRGSVVRIDPVAEVVNAEFGVGEEPTGLAVTEVAVVVSLGAGAAVIVLGHDGMRRGTVAFDNPTQDVAVAGATAWVVLAGGDLVEVGLDPVLEVRRVAGLGVTAIGANEDGMFAATIGGDVFRVHDGGYEPWGVISSPAGVAVDEGRVFVVSTEGGVVGGLTAAPGLEHLADVATGLRAAVWARSHRSDGSEVATPPPPPPALPVAVDPDEILALGSVWERVSHDEASFGGGGDQAVLDLDIGRFGIVAVGYDGIGPNDSPAIWWSSGGRDWERADLSGGVDPTRPQRLTMVATGPNGVIAAGWERRGCDRELWGRSSIGACESTGAVVWSSADGRVWQRIPDEGGVFTSGALLFPKGIVGFGDGFVMVGTEESSPTPRFIAWTSPDGIRWQSHVGDEDGAMPLAVAPLDTGLVAVGLRYDVDWHCDRSDGVSCRVWAQAAGDTPVGATWRSPDGEGWERLEVTISPENATVDLGSAVKGGAFAVVPGDGITTLYGAGANLTTADGATWQVAEHGGGAFAALIVDTGRLVALPDRSSRGRVWWSGDGVIWDVLSVSDPDAAGVGERRSLAIVGTGGSLVMAGWDTGDGDRDAAFWISRIGPASIGGDPVPVTLPAGCAGSVEDGLSCEALDSDVIDALGTDTIVLPEVRAVGNVSLVRAELAAADLRYADFSGPSSAPNLFAAILTEARLAGVDLVGADLREADLRGADLRDSVAFAGTRSLVGADLRGADLRGANLRGANLTDADLAGADLRGAVLRSAVLTRARLDGALLEGADLRGVVREGPEPGPATVVDAGVTGGGLNDGAGCVLGVGAECRRSDLRGVFLDGLDLGGADLRNAYAPALHTHGLSLVGAVLQNAYLPWVSILEADLGGVDLGGAYLRGADLMGVSLVDADLAGADLSLARLSGVDLTGADLTGADITSIRWADTTCPDGQSAGPDASTATCVGHLTPASEG